jgi:hypothetical protein
MGMPPAFRRARRAALPLLMSMMFVTSACARSRSSLDSAPRSERAGADSLCWSCATIPMDADLTRAIDARIQALLDRGGVCRTYGNVMDESFRSGRIQVRPSMWRHGTRLVAGEATPGGDMTLAREIDSLNVGRRGIDEVVWTVEHEAVHIAFGIPSTTHEVESIVNARVRSCRS